jgi:hypothetical protein
MNEWNQMDNFPTNNQVTVQPFNVDGIQKQRKRKKTFGEMITESLDKIVNAGNDRVDKVIHKY